MIGTCGEPDNASSIISTKNIIQIILHSINIYEEEKKVIALLARVASLGGLGQGAQGSLWGWSAAIIGGINQGGDVSRVTSRFVTQNIAGTSIIG
jgi:hypothetical protein